MWGGESPFSIPHSLDLGLHMIIKKVIVGELETNCYLIADEKTLEAAIIDPGDNADAILKAIRENKINPQYIINTHWHPDHIRANKELKDILKIPVCIHEKDAKMFGGPRAIIYSMMGYDVKMSAPDKLLKDGDKIEFGSIGLKVIHTPGHSKGGICLYDGSVLFSGDTLFAGAVGRTDLLGGSDRELKKSIEKLFELPPDTKVYPGHGPETDIEAEKRNWRILF